MTRSTKNWFSYQDASAWAQAEGIVSRSQWQSRCKQGLPPHIPASPQHVYVDEFLNGGWGRFLGTKQVAPQKRQFASYDEAAMWAQGEGITTQRQWQARCKLGVPEHIPTNPSKVYPDFQERGGLSAFLGLKKIVGESKIERCLRYVLEQAIEGQALSQGTAEVVGQSGQKWKVDVLLPSIGLIVEYDGSRYHHDKADIDVRKTRDLCEAGYKVVRVRGSDNQHVLPLLQQEWDVQVDENQDIKTQIATVLDHMIDLVHEGKLAVSMTACQRLLMWRTDTLHTVNFRDILDAYDGFASYADCAAWAQSEGITTEAAWRARCAQGLPPHIPSNPDKVYPTEFLDAGWGGFLGTGSVATRKRKFASYEEASVWAQGEGIATLRQWQARCKQGLPPHIPAAPNQIYAAQFAEGGWGRFLNTGKVSVLKRQYVSYDEASAWAQGEGISSQSQWMARCKQGLPAHIPSHPWDTYKDEFKQGGLRRFLGTEAKAAATTGTSKKSS